MIAFYSNGAGLGHLSRTLKVIQALNIQAPCMIISNSVFINKNKQFSALNKYCHTRNIELISQPLQEQDDKVIFLQKFMALLIKKQVNELYIDCFPVGIYGELNGLTAQIPHITAYLLARVIKWSQYRYLIESDNHFYAAYNVEVLPQLQHDYYLQHSKKVTHLPLKNLLLDQTEPLPSVAPPYCLIVHSGSLDEISQLIDYTLQKLRFSGLNYSIVLATPWSVPKHYNYLNLKIIHCYPLTHWLQSAAIIITAAGFNLMNEIQQLTAKHWVLPFDRKYDDQFTRLALSKKCINHPTNTLK